MNNPAENVWQSTVTTEMTSHLGAKEIELLIEALNDAVAEICEEFSVE